MGEEGPWIWNGRTCNWWTRQNKKESNVSKQEKILEALNSGRGTFTGEWVSEGRKRLLKKTEGLSRRTRCQREREYTQVIQQLRPEHRLSSLLKVSGMARSTFYYHLKALMRPDKYLVAKGEVARIFQRQKGRYGYRRITIDLRTKGIALNHKTVASLMKQQGLKCMVREKKYHSYRGQPGRIAPNLIQRDFKAIAPNQKLVTDVTQFSMFGQKLYLSPVMDLYNSEILGYTICERANLRMVTEMLKKVFKKLPERTNAILHSDQGWHYQNPYYQKILRDKGLNQSMSRKGNCLDNAVIENFFGILKSELLYLQKFSSMDEFIRELILYIDYYNNERIKEKLNGLSPVRFRTQSVQVI